MIVISDTTPLISLMKIGHLNLLEKYFQEVQISEAVFRELTSNPRFADEAEQIKNSQFIQVVKVKDCKSVNLLCRGSIFDRESDL